MATKEHLGHFAYYDDDGNIIGVGEDIKHTIEINSRESTSQTISAVVGQRSDDREEIDKDTFEEIRKPGANLKKLKKDKKSVTGDGLTS